MRSKPEKSNMGKVAAVLAVLAVIWLALGTATLFSIRYWIKNSTIASAPGSEEVQEEAGDEEEEDESDIDDFDDEGADLDDDMKDDQDFYDDDEINEKYGDDPDDDGSEDDDDDDDEDDDDDDDDDSDAFVQTFTVDAWDGFAAIRTGRGTGYTEVGRLNNGEKVKVKDLENGWYKIASGKWKGYYLHKSSLK